VACTARAAVAHLKTSDVERLGQQRQVARLRAALDREGIPHMENDSHIVPVMIGEAMCVGPCGGIALITQNFSGEGWTLLSQTLR